MRSIAIAVAVCLSTPAFAAGTFEILEAKITSAVDGKEAVDTKTAFTTGERAFIWMKVKPAGEQPMLRIKYSIGDKHVWTMDPVEAKLGRLWYYKTLRGPGEWKAEILDEADKVVHTLNFTVTGEPVAAGSGAAAGDSAGTTSAGTASGGSAAAAAPAAAGDSTHFAVVDLKLSGEIKDREPVAPATTFTKGAKVYAWMKLQVNDPETQVKLRWSVGKKPVFTSDPVTVKKSPGWRTWMYKTTDVAGDWAVEVLDSDDKVIQTLDFNVN